MNRNNSPHKALLAKLQVTALALDDACTREDWAEFAALLQSREGLLAELGAAEKTPEDLEILQRLRDVDEAVLRKMTAKRRGLAGDMSKLNQFKKAASVYRAHAISVLQSRMG